MAALKAEGINCRTRRLMSRAISREKCSALRGGDILARRLRRGFALAQIRGRRDQAGCALWGMVAMAALLGLSFDQGRSHCPQSRAGRCLQVANTRMIRAQKMLYRAARPRPLKRAIESGGKLPGCQACVAVAVLPRSTVALMAPPQTKWPAHWQM